MFHYKISRSLPLGARLNCACNSGVKVLKIFAIKGRSGTKKRLRTAGVGDIVLGSAKKVTNSQMKGQVFEATIIRQKKSWTRKNIYQRVGFSDNAAVITKNGQVVGTAIKGLIAKEVVLRNKKFATKGGLLY